MALVTVRLEGSLAEKFIAEMQCYASTISEILAILDANFSNFRQYLSRCGQGGATYQILVSGESVDEGGLNKPLRNGCEVVVTPAISGSGGTIGKIGLIVGGLALAATGFGAFGAAAGVIGLSASTTGLIGVTLALQGFSGLFLAPKTPGSNTKDTQGSLIMNGQINTTASGGRVPVVYGRGVIVGSQVISAYMKVRTVVFGDDDDSN